MIMLINEELGARLPLVSIEELFLMLFNEIDLLIGPKLCQFTLIWIENQINKIPWCHLNKLESMIGENRQLVTDELVEFEK